MADVIGKKISELAETTELAGLYTIGSDKNNQSKKVPLQFVKEAADYANAQGDYAKQVGDTIAGNVGVNEYPIFSASKQYAAGDVVNYNGKLYRFTSVHAAGAWVGTDAIETSIKAEIDAKLGQYETGGEYIRAYTDADGRFLWGIRHDGSIEWAKGVPAPIKKYIEDVDKNNDAEIARINQLIVELQQTTEDIDNRTEVFASEENPEYIEAVTDADGRLLKGVTPDGKHVYPKQELFDKYQDPEERLELTLDSEDKILAYRDKNGVFHERKMAVSESLALGEKAMSQLQKDLISSGFTTESPIDWSNEPTIKLPIPRYCAKVNIISQTGLAVSKTEDKKCVLEYWDKSGNYFKKFIVLNAQGSSSMAYIEKNQGIDVFNDEACEESCDIIFGNWVAQDSFHLKCYYIDVFRGVANMGYNFAEQAIQFLNSRNNRIVHDNQSITAYDSTGDFDTDFGDGALCHPDGFPFEMYVNGEYYGLFAWNLKKHRKNYSMNKKDYTAALLDGEIGAKEFFGGTIDWTAFELRNPKDLVTMDGSEYDGENPSELIDSTSSAYDASNSTHVKTAQTKALLIRQSKAVGLIAAESNADAARQLFEQYYDKRAMACYFIVGNVVYHYDGFLKNWIWALYGNIIAPAFYDLDSIFGRAWSGVKVEELSTILKLGTSLELPTGQLVRLYKSELDAMYKEMRDANIISVDNIMHHVNDWMDRVGLDAYRNNIEKWPSIPSYRAEKNMNDNTQDGGFFDSAKRIELWLNIRIGMLDKYFNY